MMFQRNLIKQYGLPRSGTNFTKALLEKYNFKVVVNKNGWKHWTYNKTNLKVFCNVKNPYSWLYSIYNFIVENKNKYCFLKSKGFLENKSNPVGGFLISRFTLNNDRKAYEFDNPIQYYNFIINNWIDNNLLIVRYEDLLINSSFMIFGKNCLTSIENTLMPGMENIIFSEDKFDKKNFYIQEKYIDFFSKENLSIIKKQINFEIIEKLKYAIL